MFIYTTWTTIASLVNLSVVVQYSHNVSATNSGTILLSLLLQWLPWWSISYLRILYFMGFFSTCLATVYPVVIWALSAELAAHWGEEGENRNNQFALRLLIITIINYYQA